MKHYPRSIDSALSAMTAIALMGTLVACGGSGGGGGPAPTPASNSTASTLTSQSVAIVTTAPVAPNYTGEELVVYNLLNTARSTCGFGYLQQSLKLDAASFNHLNWLAINNYTSHSEVSGTTGFTGVDSVLSQ